jgi:hypothetical protein
VDATVGARIHHLSAGSVASVGVVGTLDRRRAVLAGGDCTSSQLASKIVTRTRHRHELVREAAQRLSPVPDSLLLASQQPSRTSRNSSSAGSLSTS